MAREGVTVHRPQRLEGEERTFLAPNGEGAQLFPRDGMIVIGDHVIDASLRLQCRQRERYGLRPIIQQAMQRGARWSSVPLGSPGCVDGPFLEGGDTLLNGYEIYVGISGCASDLAGADWLQALLGEKYRVIPVAMKSNVLHLDCAMALIKPGLLVYCPQKLIDGLPMSLRDWDKIEVSVDEANRLATNGLVLEEGRVIIDADNARVIDELRKRKIDVIPLPFDGPIAHRRRPALRPSSAAARERAGSNTAIPRGAPSGAAAPRRCWLRRRVGLGRFSALVDVDAQRAHQHRHLAADEAQQDQGEARGRHLAAADPG